MKKPKKFDHKLSLQLDKATQQSERGKKVGRLKKRWYEWIIFGGKP